VSALTYPGLHDAVLRYVARRVRSHADAEDITQEVMLRILRNSDELDNVVRLDAWIHRIAANAIADHFRRAVRRELPSEHAGDDGQPIPEDDSGQDELRAGLARCLTPLIARLPPIYRDALRMTEIDGASQTAAASELGLSVSSMKARVQRARQQLREQLLNCCEVELDRRRAVTEIRPRGGACGNCGPRLASV
jgi:RNA polymerase sigma-70 factor (ECF subfamily)